MNDDMQVDKQKSHNMLQTTTRTDYQKQFNAKRIIK